MKNGVVCVMGKGLRRGDCFYSKMTMVIFYLRGCFANLWCSYRHVSPAGVVQKPQGQVEEAGAEPADGPV